MFIPFAATVKYIKKIHYKNVYKTKCFSVLFQIKIKAKMMKWCCETHYMIKMDLLAF